MLKKDLPHKNINLEKETKDYKTEIEILKRMFRKKVYCFSKDKEEYLKKFTEIPNEDLEELKKLKAEISAASIGTSNYLMMLDILIQFYEELDDKERRKEEETNEKSNDDR